MKQQTTFFLLAIVALCLFSCAKTESGLQRPDDSEATSQAESVSLDSGFSAYVEGQPVPVRTSVDFTDEGKVLWTTDDPILVSNGSESMTLYVKQGGGTGSTLYSTGAILAGDAFHAIYPATGASYESGVYNATIPTQQVYVSGGFADQTFPMVAACGADRQLAFKNVASLLRILPSAGTYSGQKVTAVSVSANENLAGAISVNYSQGGTPVINCSGSKSVSLTAPAGVDFGTSIYLVVAPGSYTGVKVTLTLSGGLKSVYEAGNVTVDRSKYQTISFTAVDSYVNLSASATANCYMVTSPGAYKFRADIKGNGVTTSCGLGAATSGISAVKVIYTDGQPFVDGSYAIKDGFIYFTTLDGTLPTGTAIVAALNSTEKVLWSWLIWSNPLIADVTLSDDTTWLNMNIGAHQVEFKPEGFNGYYYQWGRKDPMQQAKGINNVIDAPFVSHASKTDGSLTNSIANPLVFYGSYRDASNVPIADWCTFEDDVKYYDWWNKNITADAQTTATPAKTMFDPCPPGYHVPTFAEFANLSKLSKAAGPDFGAVVEEKLYFPCTSQRAAGISAGFWNNGVDSRGYYHCTNPKETGTKDKRSVYRFWTTTTTCGGPADSSCSRATGLVVRCKKD